MRLPSYIVEGRRPPFPAGIYVGNVGDVTTNWSEDQKNLTLNLALVENTPFDEETPQVGGRQKFQRIQLIADGVALADLEAFDDDTPLPLQQSAKLVSQLAFALGIGAQDADKSMELDVEAFLEQLTAGVFKGQPVKFEIRHRAYASRESKAAAKQTGKKPDLDRLIDDVFAFMPAQDVVADEPVQEAMPTTAPATPASALKGRGR